MPSSVLRRSSFFPAPRAPSFYHCLTEGDILRERLADLVTGLAFAFEQSGLWRSACGRQPATAQVRALRVRALVDAVPRLIPVFGHRYMLAEPCRPGNPIFSIVQSDPIIYGADLRAAFLAACADLVGLDSGAVRTEVDEAIHVRFTSYAAIPFWGDLNAD